MLCNNSNHPTKWLNPFTMTIDCIGYFLGFGLCWGNQSDRSASRSCRIRMIPRWIPRLQTWVPLWSFRFCWYWGIGKSLRWILRSWIWSPLWSFWCCWYRGTRKLLRWILPPIWWISLWRILPPLNRSSSNCFFLNFISTLYSKLWYTWLKLNEINLSIKVFSFTFTERSNY